MLSFEEYLEEEKPEGWDDKQHLKSAFEAGQKSCLDENNRLQKIIDDALFVSNQAHIGYKMLNNQFTNVVDILNGKVHVDNFRIIDKV